MKFYQWVLKRCGEDSIVGDLARDIAADESFPIGAQRKAEVEFALAESLRGAGVFGHVWRGLPGYRVDQSLACYRALRLAWQRYRDEVPRAAGSRRISLRLRFNIFERDGFRCRLCGASAATQAVLEIDHIHPVSRGGDASEANLWTLCFECNRGKATSVLKIARSLPKDG